MGKPQKNKLMMLIDGGHLSYRAYYKFKNMRSMDGVNSAIPFGGPYILKGLISKFQPRKCIAVMDGGSHKYRLELLPDYRKREKKLGWDAEDFSAQVNGLQDLLQAFGIPVVKKRGFEADDWIYKLAMVYRKKGYDILIVTGDKDFNQMLKPGVEIWNVSQNRKLTHYNLHHKIGYHPDQCIDYLTFIGDSSDNIPGVPGVGEKGTAQFLEEHYSIKQFLHSESSFKKLDKKKLREIYTLNRKLISLPHFYIKFMKKMPIAWVGKSNPRFSHKKVLDICRKYDIGTFLKPEYLEAFKSVN